MYGIRSIYPFLWKQWVIFTWANFIVWSDSQSTVVQLPKKTVSFHCTVSDLSCFCFSVFSHIFSHTYLHWSVSELTKISQFFLPVKSYFWQFSDNAGLMHYLTSGSMNAKQSRAWGHFYTGQGKFMDIFWKKKTFKVKIRTWCSFQHFLAKTNLLFMKFYLQC